jgi:hypothetical protein
MRWHWLHRVIELPRYVVLVRDIRDALIANYEKWKHVYDVSFSEYLRGDMSGRRYNSDIWWCMRFLNGWGRIIERFPERVLVIRYEDLQRNADGELDRLNRFWRLELEPSSLTAAAKRASKQTMVTRHDPARPAAAIRLDDRDRCSWYSDQDAAFLSALCRHYLHYSFGYEY